MLSGWLNLSKNQLLIVGSVFFVVIITVLIFTGILPGFTQKPFPAPVQLNFMGFDDRRVYQPIIDAFQKLYPHIRVNYQQVDSASYEEVLIDDLAAGRGPDIFMFHNTWLPKHFDKVFPASESQLPLSQLEALFPTVVRQDFAPDGTIYALPLYIDTLALFYNKSIFDDKSIALPPANWLEFQKLVSRLPLPAAAIGGSADSIHRATDILSLLFLQSGTPMIDSSFSRANFASQGLSALNFYLKFSDPKSEFYTWNDSQPFSLAAFADGRLPMMFHYLNQANLLRRSAPFLDFGVALMPQPVTSGPAVNFANYYGLAVSGRTFYPKEAWDFIIFATTNTDASLTYLEGVGQSPALRSLINLNINSADIGVFAKQALTARSWPQIDNKAVENSFSRMIKSVLTGALLPDQALRQSEAEITQLIQRKIR